MTGEDPVVLLARHDRFLAVDKPAGRLSHGRGGVLEEVRRRFGPEWRLAHRLDRETSGVLLLAEGLEALALVHDAWRGKVRKRYLCAARLPELPERSGRIDAPILEFHSDRPHLLRRALKAGAGAEKAERLMNGEAVDGVPPIPPPGRSALHPLGRPAATRWTLLAARPPLALLGLEPEQGRMHQLRLHVRALGGEILGDRFYGDRPDLAWDEIAPESGRAGPVVGRLALHVESILWEVSPDGSPWLFEAARPPDLAPVLGWVEEGSGRIPAGGNT